MTHIRIMISIISTILLFTATAAATTVKFCATWAYQFQDAGYGEDYFNSPNVSTVEAKYAWAKITKNGNTLYNEPLDGNGCSDEISGLSPGDRIVFTRYTLIKVTGGRKIWILPTWRTGYAASDPDDTQYLSSAHTLPSTWSTTGSYTLTAGNSWVMPEINIAVVATQALRYYNSREYPANTNTYINTNFNFCGGTYFSPGSSYWTDSPYICVSPHQHYINANGVETVYDHSAYKFNIAHEIGHRTAWKNHGPKVGDYGIVGVQTSTPHPCNCEKYLDHNVTCVQGKSRIGKSQMEGFAMFYSAALFNDRSGYGKIAYWRELYDSYVSPSGTWNSVWDDTPPVPISAGVNKKWMEHFCSSNSSDRGTTFDWISFFWNLWVKGSASEQFSVNQISDVWEEALLEADFSDPDPDVEEENVKTGLTWFGKDSSKPDMLDEIARDMYGFSSDRYNHFVNMADDAGVNH